MVLSDSHLPIVGLLSVSMIKRFVLAALCLAAVGCENDMATVRKFGAADGTHVETGDDIEMLYSNDAKVRARLVAPHLKRINAKDGGTEFDKGLVAFFYDDSLNQTSRLTAAYGRIDERSNDMLVRDKVEVINSNGETLQTEELIWNNKTRRITTDKFVKIQSADEIIYG